MIYVDQLRACGAPWRGGVACHMLSDSSLDELLVMGEKIGMRRAWLQQPPRSSMVHFDLARRHRVLALRFGAVDCDGRELVRAGQRFRAENPWLFPRVAAAECR